MVGVVSGVLTAIVLYAGAEALQLAQVLDFSGSVPAWLAALLVGASAALALLGGRAAARRDDLVADVRRLEDATDALGSYELYSEHLRDALADLRRLLNGELPAFSVGDYIEKGIFETAHRLLTREGDRGDVRFSVLHVEGGFLVMARGRQMFPALGHSLEARQQFRLALDDAFAGIAYRTGRMQSSGDVDSDERFKRHPKARPGREYRSIVSVPLRSGDAVDGVLNVIATKSHAFSRVDENYLRLLAAVIDVARVAADRRRHLPDTQE